MKTLYQISRAAILLPLIFTLAACDFFPGPFGDEAEIHLFHGDREILGNDTLDFGTVGESEVSRLVLTIRNLGEAELRFTAAPEISGSDALQFEIIEAPASTVAPRSSGSLSIEFHPTDAGQMSAVCTLYCNDPVLNIFSFTLTGSMEASTSGAPNLSVSSGSGTLFSSGDEIDFGTVTTANSTVGYNLILANDGNADLNLDGDIIISGVDAGQFGVAAQPSEALIASGESIDLIVNYAPTAAGEALATATISSNDPDTPDFVLQLRGNYTPPDPVPEIRVGIGATVLSDGDTVFFGEITDDSSSARVFRIENLGTGDLALFGVGIDGDAYNEFSLTAAPPASILPGEWADVEVIYDPAEPGESLAALNITSDDADEGSVSLILRGVYSPPAQLFYVEFDSLGDDSFILAADIAANGDIYMAGRTYVTADHADIFVAKVSSDGVPDAGFGSGGFFIFPGSADKLDSVRSIELIESAGVVQKILLGAYTYLGTSSTYNDSTVIQLNADGTLDTAFGGGDGYYLVDNPTRPSSGFICRDPSTGNIYVPYGEVGGTFNARIIRLNSSGALDNSFNGSGYLDIDAYGWTDYSRWFYCYGGMLYYPVYSYVYGNNDKAYGGILRYNLDGSLDTSFGETNAGATNYGATNSGKQGWAMWPPYNDVASGQWEDASSYIAFGADGTLYLTGRDALSNNGATQRGYVVKFSNDGVLDSSYGTGGAYYDTGGTGSDNASTHYLCIDSLGNAYVRGADYNLDPRDDYIFKLDANGDLDTTFAGDGYLRNSERNFNHGTPVYVDDDHILILGRNELTGKPAAYMIDAQGNPK